MNKRFQLWEKVLLIQYIGFLLYFLIFSEWYGRSGMTSEYQYNLVPFQEIKRFWDYRDQLGILSFTNLAGNILIFVPFGFLEAIVMKNRRNLLTVTLDGFLISLFVEVSQLVMMVGCFDVDDLILNTMGTMIGYILFKSCNTMRRRYGEKRTGK